MYLQRISRASGCLFVLVVTCFAIGVSASNPALPSMQAALHSPNAPTSLLLDIARVGDRLVAVGEQGHIIYSDSDGKDWVHAQVPVSLMLTAVAFPTERRGWAVGHDGIVLISDDRGATWQIQLDGRKIVQLQMQAGAARVKELEALEQETEEGPDKIQRQDDLDDAVFDLEDAESLQTNGIVTPLLGVKFLDELQGFAYGAYGLLLETRDGGDNWSLLSNRLDNPDKFHLYALAVAASGALVMSGEAGTLYVSEDQGGRWERLAIDYSGSLFGVLATPDGALITFGLRGKIFRSSDGGANWESIDTEPQKTLTAGRVFSNARIVLVGASGVVLESRDDGRSFSVVDSGSRDVFSSIGVNSSGQLVVTGFGGIKFLENTQP